MGPASTTLQPVEPLAADHVKADMDRAMCCSGSWDGPSQASTPAIVCAFIRGIRSLMQQDWLRVEGDVRQLGGVCPSWFRGRDPSLPLQRFQSWWCAEDVLASTQLVVGGQPRMVLKLSRFSVPGLPL